MEGYNFVRIFTDSIKSIKEYFVMYNTDNVPSYCRIHLIYLT